MGESNSNNKKNVDVFRPTPEVWYPYYQTDRRYYGYTGIYGSNYRRKALRNEVLENGTFLPREICIEDLDIAFRDFIQDDMTITIDKERVPVEFMTRQRWQQFSKSWYFADDIKNPKIPYITIMRESTVELASPDFYYNIPNHDIKYITIPVWNGNRTGYNVYKIPQPTQVYSTFNVRIFTLKLRDLNKFNKTILKRFDSGPHYIKVKGHYMPISLESISDESQLDNFESKTYYAQNYTFKLKGFLIDGDDMKILPGIEKVEVNVDTAPKMKRKPKIIESIGDNGNETFIEFEFNQILNSFIRRYTIDNHFHLNEIKTDDGVGDYVFWVNSIRVDEIPIDLKPCDEIKIQLLNFSPEFESAQITLCLEKYKPNCINCA